MYVRDITSKIGQHLKILSADCYKWYLTVDFICISLIK